jgi:hypothetical protein
LYQQKNKQGLLNIGWMMKLLKSDFDEQQDEQNLGYEYLPFSLLVCNSLEVDGLCEEKSLSI